MREIKFRGWRRKYQEWMTGYLVIREEPYLHDIIQPIGDNSSVTGAVERDSVGQYTGLKDKNDVEVYEGDILMQENGLFKGVVKFGHYEEYSDGGYGEYTGFYLDMVDEGPSGGFQFYLDGLDSIVIGNIYENPELLKEAPQ